MLTTFSKIYEQGIKVIIYQVWIIAFHLIFLQRNTENVIIHLLEKWNIYVYIYIYIYIYLDNKNIVSDLQFCNVFNCVFHDFPTA